MAANGLVKFVSADGDSAVISTDRFTQLANELPNSKVGYPRHVHFIGKRQKQEAIKHLFPFNNSRTRAESQSNYFISMKSDTRSLNTDYPLYFSESDPIHSARSDQETLPATRINWAGPDTTVAVLTDAFLCRVLFLFVDIVCVFLDDFGSPREFTDRLEQWLSYGSSSTMPRKIRPHLMVVSTGNFSRSIFTPFMQNGMKDSFLEVFSRCSMVTLGPNSLSPLARYRKLRDTISVQSSTMLQLRSAHHAAFAADHLGPLFAAAVDHYCRNLQTPFDFISATRVSQETFEISSLSYFVNIGRNANIKYTELVTFIASAFLMDAYPPKMHKFEPTWFFRHCYLRCCQLLYEGCRTSPLDPLDVQNLFVQLANYVSYKTSSADIRAEVLRRSPTSWSQLKPHNLCLLCLRRPPEHFLTCGHTICDNCVMIFAHGQSGGEQIFHLNQCVLCQSSNDNIFRLKPVTAGVRILSVDGGGTRGVVPLEYLCLLQEMLLGVNVRDCFDLAIGTSSGGLIVLGLYSLCLSPGESSALFEQMSRSMFGNKTDTSSFLSSLGKLVRTWWSDGIYDTASFEDMLQAVFGSSTCMFASSQKFSASRIAVVTCSISDSTPYLIPSYNGPSGNTPGYSILRGSTVDDDLPIWKAARATSAAPMLYQTVEIGDHGSFQDGGMSHNNPSRLALWEARRLWPQFETPDLFLSLGTGSNLDQPRGPAKFRNFVCDGFIPRMFRSSINKLDGEIMWTEFTNCLMETQKPSFYRLNIHLRDNLMIDDVDSMQSLKQAVRSQEQARAQRSEIAYAILLSSFYLELDSMPYHDKGALLVTASIKCRLPPAAVFEALSHLGADFLEFETDQKSLGRSDLNGICVFCKRYRHKITFRACSITGPIDIYVKSRIFGRRRLSGLPKTLDWFIKMQGLGEVFGSVNHGIPGALKCFSCDPTLHAGGAIRDRSNERKRVRLMGTIRENQRGAQSTWRLSLNTVLNKHWVDH